jgi:hypothetical protein
MLEPLDQVHVGPAGSQHALFERGDVRAHVWRRSTWLIGLLAFALYLPGFWWGAPHATGPDRTNSWGVDDVSPIGPLGEMQGIVSARDYENLGYPLMSSFMMAAAYAPYLGYQWISGGLSGVSGDYPFGLADPVRTLKVLTWIAHFLSVLMGAGVVAAAYDAATRLWDRRTALWAALFAMLVFPMFYYSRNANVDVPVLFFTSLAINAYARILVGGLNTHRALALGAAVGFALATKETASASFLGVLPVVIGLAWLKRPPGTNWRSTQVWRPILLAGLATFLALGVGSGMFADPQRYFAHLAFVRDRVNALAEGQVAFATTYPRTTAGHIALFQLLGGYLIDALTLPGLALALIGIGWTLRREPVKALFALPGLTYFGVLFWSARGGQLRYIMPVALTLAFFAAVAVSYAWQSTNRLVRYGFGATAMVALALSLLRGIDLTHAMIKDSRYAAGAWINKHARSGDELHYFDADQKLPPLPSSVVTRRANIYLGAVERPRIDAAAVSDIRKLWERRAPRFVIIIPDHSTRGDLPYSASCPPEIYEGLLDGSLGYRLAAMFETPALMPWVRRPSLDYPSVNPPIRIFVRNGS